MMRDKRASYHDVFGSEKYKVIVLDMDGTLYYQRGMQILMLLEMGAYAVRHPFSLWKLRVISLFRNIREQDIFAKDEELPLEYHLKEEGRTLLQIQYQMVADRIDKTAEVVAQIIEEWMFKRPLKHLQYTCDRKLSSWFFEWKRMGKKVVIYSDYPVKEKCSALELEADAMYSSEEKRIGRMKPSVKGLEIISRDLAAMPDEMLVIGDRLSKDGKMAEAFGCDYVILAKWKIIRNRYY